METSWQATTLVQCVSVQPWLLGPGCDEPGGCDDLTLDKTRLQDVLRRKW